MSYFNEDELHTGVEYKTDGKKEFLTYLEKEVLFFEETEEYEESKEIIYNRTTVSFPLGTILYDVMSEAEDTDCGTEEEKALFVLHRMINIYSDYPSFCDKRTLEYAIQKYKELSKYKSFGDYSLSQYDCMDESERFAKVEEQIIGNFKKVISGDYSYKCFSNVELALASLDGIFSNRLIIRKCKNCGKIFIPNSRTDEKYCSVKCRDSYFNKKKVKTINENQIAKLKHNLKGRLGNKASWDEKVYWQFLDECRLKEEEINSKRISKANKDKQFIEWLEEQDRKYQKKNFKKGGSKDGK